MDTTSKLFIFMIVLAVVIGAFVISFKPQHNLATVYKSNARYYPHINDETVLKKIQKPKPTEESSGGIAIPQHMANSNSPATQKFPKKTKKKVEDEFVPD